MPQHNRAAPKTLVIGGSTGIGRGIADAWARAGAEVTVMSRTKPAGDNAEALSWVPIDLTDTDAAREALSEAAIGGLDAACYSAVHYGDRRAPVGAVAEPEWRRQIEVNLHGLWLTLTALLPVLRRADPGLFVGVSSEVVYNGGPGRSGYAATKAAAAALLDSVAQEQTDSRVRIVQVLPSGMVDTPGIRRRRPSDFDYGDYMRPDHFGELATTLLAERGANHHGDALVVAADGQWHSIREQVPDSQSKALVP